MTFLCIGVALFLQIAVNFANDYSDGIRGVDDGRSVPESHTADGSRTASSLPAQPAATAQPAAPAQPVTKVTKPQRLVASGVPPKQVLAAAGIAAALACICGLAASIISGQYWLIALGALCLLAGWFYTGGHQPYGYAGLGEVSVFVFFGLVATLGTEFVICQSFDGFGIPNVTRFDFAQPFADSWNGWVWFWQGQFGIDLTGLVAAVCCGLNAVLLLMVNNLRDITEDKQHGKRTLAVRLGERGARIALIVCLALDVLLVAILVTVLWFAWGMILLLSSLAVPVRIVRSIARHDFRWALADAGYWNLFFLILFVICMGASGIGQ
ncbi:UbiA family prenyltransferase [Bifidobacterium hapali]